jgi:preprotein translocase subunit SecG
MDFQAFAPYLSIVVIILAVVVTALVLMQSKGSDLAGFLGGGDTGGFRTKRGIVGRLILYRCRCNLISAGSYSLP